MAGIALSLIDARLARVFCDKPCRRSLRHWKCHQLNLHAFTLLVTAHPPKLDAHLATFGRSLPPHEEHAMELGTVKFFNDQKGFSFRVNYWHVVDLNSLLILAAHDIILQRSWRHLSVVGDMAKWPH